MATNPTDPPAPRPARAMAAAVLSRYPPDLGRAELLARVCRDEGIELLDADLWDVRGVLRHEAGGWRLYLSRQDAPGRRLLTLAHLLGHFFLHGAEQRTFVDGPLVAGCTPPGRV